MASRYVKPTKTTWAPRRLLAVAVNLVALPTEKDRGLDHLAFDEGACLLSRWNGKKWKSFDSTCRVDPANLWADVCAALSPRETTYVLCENVSEWLTAGLVYERMDRNEIDLPGLRWEFDAIPDTVGPKGRTRRAGLIVGGQTEIVRCRVGGAWLTIVGVGNYVGRSVEDVYKTSAEAIGGDMPTRVRLGLHRTDPSIRCRLLAEWGRGVIAWWREIDGGSWRDTAAGLAHSLFRRRHLKGKLLQDDHEAQHRLVRAALHGGRASTWFYGPIGSDPSPRPAGWAEAPASRLKPLPGPIYHLDCRSLYASLLHSGAFPVRFRSFLPKLAVDELASRLEFFGMAAHVRLDTGAAEYPIRRWLGKARLDSQERDARRSPGGHPRERTDYPVGQFWTTLCGEELERAVADGIVVDVAGGVTYEMQPAFKSFAAELLDARRAAGERGDTMRAQFSKLLANAFAGKFAQRSGGWRLDMDTEPRAAWGAWSEVDASSGECRQFRAISGVVQRLAQDDGKPCGIPQIFAFLTAMGRMAMRRLRELCPPMSVVSQDTDSLWVLQPAFDALQKAGEIHRDTPGKLRLLGKFHTYLGWSPRHYYCDGTYTLAGLASGWKRLGEGKFTDEQRHPYGLIGSGETPTDCISVRRTIALGDGMQSDPIGADGWAEPIQLGYREEFFADGYSAGSSPPPLFPDSPLPPD